MATTWLRIRSLATMRFAVIGAVTVAFALVGSTAVSQARVSMPPSATTRCTSVGNGGGSSGAVEFALARCQTSNGTHGTGTLFLFKDGTTQIVWKPPFEGGTPSHPATWAGTYSLRVSPNPDETESANQSCPVGETEDDITGAVTRFLANPNQPRTVHGSWRMEICGPPTALEPGTAFRVRIGTAT